MQHTQEIVVRHLQQQASRRRAGTIETERLHVMYINERRKNKGQPIRRRAVLMVEGEVKLR